MIGVPDLVIYEEVDIERERLVGAIRASGERFRIALSTGDYRQVISYARENSGNNTVYFLDIMYFDTEQDLGFKLYDYILCSCTKASIVFVTDREKELLDNMHYKKKSLLIRKRSPNFFSEVRDLLLDTYFIYLNDIGSCLYEVKSKYFIAQVPYAEIMMFEKIKNTHSTKIFHLHGELETSQQLNEILDITNGYFCQSRNCALINPSQIYRIEKSTRKIVFIDGRTTYYSRHYAKEVFKSYELAGGK